MTSCLMGFFILVLLGSGFYSEFFQSPLATQSELDRYRTLYTSNDFENLTSLKVENRLGKFSLKNESDSVLNWSLQTPRQLPANSESIKQIISTLEDVKIRRVYPKDQINLSNFSLNNPLVKITMTTTKQIAPYESDTFNISIGLLNPIDGSTYITASNKDAIYHIEPISNPIELMGLSDFVDSRVVSLPETSITEVQIYRGSIDSGRQLLSISRTESNEWVSFSSNNSNDPRDLETQKVREFLVQLRNIRAQLILDKRTEALESAIDRLFNRPHYSFSISDLEGEPVLYETSAVINQALPDLRLEPGESFIVRASNRQHPYVVHKDTLSVLSTTYDNLKKLPLNKLFY